MNGLLWFSTFPEKKTAFLHAIYVEPNHRKKGIADNLMNYLEQYCVKNNLGGIELNVTVNLSHAVKFYQKKGFEIKRYAMSKKI